MNQKHSVPTAMVLSVIVGMIVIAIRIPSCYESFWVDELHSTWCVWGSMSDVAPRARIGNQSPLWFWLLWIWKQFAGQSEVGLRMISVLATAVASMSLCFCIARKFSSTAGMTAGLMLAIESNSIFFGTELRPYAVIVMLAAIACCYAIGNHRAVIPISILASLAIWVQPTSAVVMFGLLAVTIVKRRMQSDSLSRSECVWLGLAFLCTVIVVCTVLFPSWEGRERWAAFAVAPPFASAVKIWSWWWIWAIPLVLITLSSRHRSMMQLTELCLLAGLCVAVVLVFWVASRSGLVHLWHRRYFIALLPVFAALVGGSVSLSVRWSRLDWGVASVLLVGLAFSQGTLHTIAANPAYLAYRGEDWRAAIKHLRQTPEKTIGIDAGLIEAREYIGADGKIDLAAMSPLMREYLTCVVEGPYRLGSVTGVPEVHLRASQRGFLTRSPVQEPHIYGAAQVMRFGSVTCAERLVSSDEN